MIAKNGFCVVAPSRMTAAFLDVGQQHVLLGAVEVVQLIDEENGPLARLSSSSTRASWSISRTSLMPAATALSGQNRQRVCKAMTCAREVLPQPGGPWKISEPSRSAASSRRNSLSGPRKCSWPTNSSSVRGRMRAASGKALEVGLVGGGEQVGVAGTGFAHAASTLSTMSLLPSAGTSTSQGVSVADPYRAGTPNGRLGVRRAGASLSVLSALDAPDGTAASVTL